MRPPTDLTYRFLGEIEHGDVVLFRRSFEDDGTMDPVHQLILALDGGTFNHAGIAVRAGNGLRLCDVTAATPPIQLGPLDLDSGGCHQVRYRRLDRPAADRRRVAERALRCEADQVRVGFAYGYVQLIQAAIAGLFTGRPNLPVRADVIRQLLDISTVVAAQEARAGRAGRSFGITCAGFVALCHEPVGGLHVSNARWHFGTRSSVYTAAIDDVLGSFGRVALDLVGAVRGTALRRRRLRRQLYPDGGTDLSVRVLWGLLTELAGELEYGEGNLLTELTGDEYGDRYADGGGDAPPGPLDAHLAVLEGAHQELSAAAWAFAEVLAAGPALAADLATTDLTNWLEQRADAAPFRRVDALRRLAKLPQVQLMGISDLEFTPTLSGPSWSYHRPVADAERESAAKAPR